MLEQEITLHLHNYTNQICLTSGSDMNQTHQLLKGKAARDYTKLRAGTALDATTEVKRWTTPGLLHLK